LIRAAAGGNAAPLVALAAAVAPLVALAAAAPADKQAPARPACSRRLRT
jgi:hypothetical protein